MEADHSWDPILHGDRADGYRLIPGSGGGGALAYDWSFWLWPLPPAGPVTVNVMWEQRGIPETATVVDLGTFVACAAQATELWPLPDQPREAGWPVIAPAAGGQTHSELRVGPASEQCQPAG